MEQREIFEIAFMLQSLHFEGRELKCDNCNTFKDGNCEGGLRSSDDVKFCMINKVAKNEKFLKKYYGGY